MFDDRQLDGDLVDAYQGVNLVTDKMSAPYLGGKRTIDFVDTIEAQGFTIDNPNASNSLRLRRLIPLSPGFHQDARGSAPTGSQRASFFVARG